MRELNNVKVIGTDHGFGNMKVASACFRSGVTLCEKEPAFKENLLVYEGRYYLIGESHKEFTPDKMRDEDYYILTLAAIAEELHANGLTGGLVYIAAGLPLTWVSEQKDRFRAYLTQNYNVSFTFRATSRLREPACSPRASPLSPTNSGSSVALICCATSATAR